MKTIIRPFTLRDYDAALDLWKSCEGIGLTDADSRDGTASFLRRNRGLSVVAVRAGRLVGTALCGHDGRRGFIYHLAVAPAVRRKGIGRTLVEQCLRALRQAGIHKCHVVVFGRNRKGRQFWENIGWVERKQLRLMSKPSRPG
jgi:N-acetylglutamate synthase